MMTAEFAPLNSKRQRPVGKDLPFHMRTNRITPLLIPGVLSHSAPTLD